MKNDQILDNFTNNYNLNTSLISVGVLYYFSLVSFLYLTKVFLRDVFLILGIDSYLITPINMFLGIITILFLTSFYKRRITKLINSENFKIKTEIIFLAFAIVLIQLLQFMYPFTLQEYFIEIENYLDQLSDYYSVAAILILDMIYAILKPLLVGFLFMKKEVRS